tara:strand:- start:802 stop:1464 length:663 start_codon:yes stop_codon:yes gene_type:complete
MSQLHPETFEFLKKLAANNSKEWMDANRAWYQDIRQGLINFAQALNDAFAEVYPMPVGDIRKSVARINNNRRFHPNKPLYKDHFGLMMKRQSPKHSDFYIHLAPETCFVGTGLYHPPKEALDALRDLIAQKGEVLLALRQKPAFKKLYGDFSGEQLKTYPRGFSADHPHIDLLRYKDLIITRDLAPKDFLKKDACHMVKEYFAAAQDFMDFIDEALELQF